MSQYVGMQSIVYDKPPYITEVASVVGKKEGDGPIGQVW